MQEPLPKWAQQQLAWTRKRARRAGIVFALTSEHMSTLIVRAGGRCEVTGHPFSFEAYHSAFRRPFVPSLDRIDSAKGYKLENCRLVVYAANAAMNEWGAEVLFAITRSLAQQAQFRRRRVKGSGADSSQLFLPFDQPQCPRVSSLYSESSVDRLLGLPAGTVKGLRLVRAVEPMEYLSKGRLARCYSLGAVLQACERHRIPVKLDQELLYGTTTAPSPTT